MAKAQAGTFELSLGEPAARPGPDETVAPTDVPSCTHEELDALPFGVIELDRDGAVLRYNLTEARFARLDRANVLGQNFFTEVAPCTRTPAFEGRIQAFFGQEPEARAELSSFSYVFDFKFGAQQVSVEIVKCADPSRVCLCIGRTSCIGPRSGLPEGFYAPNQTELAPRERFSGIHRDGQQQRFVRADAPFFSAMTQTWRRLAPEAWQPFSREWGRAWGMRSLVELEASALQDEGRSIEELPMKTVLGLVRRWGLEQGWGELRPDFGPAKHGVFFVWLDRSAIAEATGIIGTKGCTLLEGWLSAVFSRLGKRPVVSREIWCRSCGDKRCLFVLVGANRSDELDRAIDAGLVDPAALVDALSK